jgi:hypothetical protein
MKKISIDVNKEIKYDIGVENGPKGVSKGDTDGFEGLDRKSRRKVRIYEGF